MPCSLEAQGKSLEHLIVFFWPRSSSCKQLHNFILTFFFCYSGFKINLLHPPPSISQPSIIFKGFTELLKEIIVSIFLLVRNYPQNLSMHLFFFLSQQVFFKYKCKVTFFAHAFDFLYLHVSFRLQSFLLCLSLRAYV